MTNMVYAVINERYELSRRIGSGGMGDVWLATDTLLGRPVALKFVGEKELRETPAAVEILLRDEARTAGILIGHAQIANVLDLIEVNIDLHKGPALVMEYVDGCNLAEWIEVHSPRIEDDSTRILLGLHISLQLIEAIDIAHKRSIIHRDIKPQNILCAFNGLVKVADFGLSRLVEAITRTHTVWGRHTPLYAAPEQWHNEKPTVETDIYQICATIYHLIAGRPANDASTLLGLFKWHQDGSKARPLIESAPLIGAQISYQVMQGLESDPESRGDLWELSDAISRFVMGPTVMSISTKGCDGNAINSIATLTDVPSSEFHGGLNDFEVSVPNGLEACREAIGIVLLGGMCTVSHELSRAKK